MSRSFIALCLMSSSVATTALADETRRIAVVVARNDGGADRPMLRYAHTDAQAFADVLVDVGGVERSDVHLLLEPNRAALFDALAGAGVRAELASSSGARVETLVYYSGHSDIDGVILGAERVSYADIKAAIQRIRSDVRIVVLDSCASGAFTRLKGGQRRPPLFVDEALAVQGTAVLTSSSADEAAQESERLRGSFFTHALVAGLRGAGDTSGDGRVTLTEAYQYAFADTLSRTERTSGGAQHAAFDIRLSGTGDLVMTDLRDTSSTLVIDDGLAGRVFVRDASGRLVAEVTKVRGAALALAVPAGRYDVVVQRASSVHHANVLLAHGAHIVTDADLVAIEAERTVARGPALHDAPTTSAPSLVFLGGVSAVAVGVVGAITLGSLATSLHVDATNADGAADRKQLALDAGPWLIAGTAGGAALAVVGAFVVAFAE